MNTDPAAPAPPAWQGAPRGWSYQPAAEVALVGVSLASIICFGRLFSEGDWFGRLALLAISSHALAIGMRRLNRSLLASAAVSLVGFALAVGWILYPSTTVMGLPLGDTLSAFRTDLGDVWLQFQEVEAPTPLTPAFLAAGALAFWVCAFVADWAGFRLWVPFEAIVPAGTLFVFASLFAGDDGAAGAAALFLASVFAFVLLHRVTRQQLSAGWVALDSGRGPRAMLVSGTAVGGAALLTCLALGPQLPGADSDAVIAWNENEESGGSRTTVSPLVQIQSRLLEQTFTELFTVQSDQPSYWRLTALDRFDGSVWSSNGEFGRARGRLEGDVGGEAPASQPVIQDYQIANLATIWLPAAFRPTAVDYEGTDVRWEARSATLIVDSSIPTSDGARYRVTSTLPRYDVGALAAATGAIPPDIAAEDLAIPEGFSPAVVELAQQIVAGATTPYEQAKALQDYFRSGEFAYSLEVPPGHSGEAIERFLFDTKAGYCEQFAGTFAAMARAIGLPARVAVGFTPGELDPATAGLYHVKGEHAHAWPEVWIPGNGWVLFEPTPGRGAPGAEDHTGVDAEQSVAGGGATAPPETTPAPPPTTTPAPQPGGDVAGQVLANLPLPCPDPLVTALNPGLERELGGAPPEDGCELGTSWWREWGRDALRLISMVLLAAVIWLVGVPAWRAYARRRRRARAVEPADRVRVAWAESVEDVAVLGIAPSRAETATEFAARLRPVLETDLPSDLARTLEAADYSPGGVTSSEADEALDQRVGIGTAVRARSTRQQRLRAVVDPRRPERRRRPSATDRDRHERHPRKSIDIHPI